MRSHLDHRVREAGRESVKACKDSARVETLKSNHHLIADGHERFPAAFYSQRGSFGATAASSAGDSTATP